MHIRWCLRRDLPEMCQISGKTEEELLNILRHRNNIGMCVEGANYSVVGFMIYQLQKYFLQLLVFEGECKERLLDRLLSKLNGINRTAIHYDPYKPSREEHLLFCSKGFQTIKNYSLKYDNLYPFDLTCPELEGMPPTIQWDYMYDNWRIG